MEKKICRKCKIKKDISEFHKNKYTKDGLQWYCKKCRSRKTEKHKREEDLCNKLFEIGKRKCRECGKEKELIFFGKEKSSLNGYRRICKECRQKMWQMKKYGKSDSYRNYQREYQRKWKESHRDIVNSRAREYSRSLKCKKWRMERSKKPEFKLMTILHNRVNRIFKRAHTHRAYKTMKMLGCSIDFFKKYIESKFHEGMTWNNYGYYGWHFDHIIPCASFDLTDSSQQLKCFHYTNYQPMWRKENLLKSSWYNGKQCRYKK